MDKKKIVKNALSAIKMHDAGRKLGEPKPIAYSSPTKSYPRLYLSAKEAPALAGANVGDKMTLVLHAEVTSHSSSHNRHNKSDNYDLEIHKIGKSEK